MTTVELRENFIQYFKKNDHKFMVSSKVHNDDPTLMFVNAGMNQLKSTFLGTKTPDEKYTKLVNSQICIRAGGKHNDLDDVGYDRTHLTSFEMLGNWSLNKYKKEEAIRLAFTYLIEECGLDKERMYVSYFEGTDTIPKDVETYEIWKKFMPVERIVPGNFKDNFWMMADDGPCGACTEIHYDVGINKGEFRCEPSLVNHEYDGCEQYVDVMEIWNVVFIEYNKDDAGYHKLDKFYVDTGMGLERLSLILQEKGSVFETDALNYLISYAQIITRCCAYNGTFEKHIPSYMKDVAYRVFADHMRTIVVTLYDGVSFGSKNKEFVLRKIFRRMTSFIYIHLLKGKISPLMKKPVIKCLIRDVLTYFKKKHNDNMLDKIHNMLVNEEMLYIGKLQHLDRKINKYKKKYDDWLDKLLEIEGISKLIVDNQYKIKVL
jgi:alanyl-tRNA synthetase